MENPSIQNRLADTKAAFEVNTLQKFYDMLNNDPDRAFYGWSHVNYAAEQGAIMTLLISDGLFRYFLKKLFEISSNNVNYIYRSDSIQIRRQYTKLVESVKDGGGNVAIFSSLHVSGEQLNQLTGIAAILKFPLPDIDDLELMNLEDEMKLKHQDQDEDEINY
jgi:protein pelota